MDVKVWVWTSLLPVGLAMIYLSGPFQSVALNLTGCGLAILWALVLLLAIAVSREEGV